MPYPWYAVVTGPILEQGDLLKNCLDPVLPRTTPSPEQPAALESFNRFDRVVVLSQSCDLATGDLRRVMVCPVYTLEEFLNNYGSGKSQRNDAKSKLQKGRFTAHHLLNVCDVDRHSAPHLVADFGDAFSIPLEYAVELAGAGERIRLLPPYREQLAQNFARFYMRVGLPIDVAKFP
jgi:hypothetical protein